MMSWCWWARGLLVLHTQTALVLFSLASAAFPYAIILHINICRKGNKLMCLDFMLCSGKAGNNPG